mmetsp:Transcript_15104/g.38846  ORF Transcript_15104/g.38846 Transcript_15104/m.38846 type:complete len:106 (-) Transcript_15104:42-359(-)
MATMHSFQRSKAVCEVACPYAKSTNRATTNAVYHATMPYFVKFKDARENVLAQRECLAVCEQSPTRFDLYPHSLNIAVSSRTKHHGTRHVFASPNMMSSGSTTTW